MTTRREVTATTRSVGTQNNISPAGNVSRYCQNWFKITKNSFLNRIIKEGYKIQFSKPPFLDTPVISSPKCTQLRKALQTQINRNLSSGAISVIPYDNGQYVSRVFTVKKSNGNDRMIIDLSDLNKQIIKSHFKMESLDVIKSLVSSGDYFVSIDLADAFFTIPLHDDSKKYTVFEFNNCRYCYNVLPFGLTSSPRIFSKILKPVISFLRTRGIKISAYLDDIFICNNSKELLSEQLKTTISLLNSLGFTINYGKSHLIPSQSLLHLGYIWNSENMTLSLPSEKLSKTKVFAKTLLNKSPSVRQVSAFLGLLVSHRNAFPQAPLYYRGLQFCMIKSMKLGSSWDDLIVLDSNAIKDLEWWLYSSSFPPAKLLVSKPDLTLSTDASNSGWGGVLSSGSVASGTWSREDATLHINVLELKAIYLSISHFNSELKNSSVSILSDNMSAVTYVNKFGGTHSVQMCNLAVNIWKFCLQNEIICSATYIPGVENSMADYLSRHNSCSPEFSLCQTSFNEILRILHINPTIDMFASFDNYKLNCYVSLFPDHNAFKIDAFSFLWPNNIYIFPPIPLISRVMSKLLVDGVDSALLITPSWSSLPSLPIIIDHLVSDPVYIYSSSIEGCLPTRRPFCLMAWHISGSTQKNAVYLKKRQRRCYQVFPPQHLVHIKDIGNTLLLGLITKGIWVEFLSQ